MSNTFRDNMYENFPDPNKKIEELEEDLESIKAKTSEISLLQYKSVNNTWDIAIKQAITDAINISGKTGLNTSILVPKGVYEVEDLAVFSNVTFSDIGSKRGISFKGENAYSSVFLLKTNGQTKWFYNNGDNKPKFERLVFEDIGFTSDSDVLGNGFNIWSSGIEKMFHFYRCAFGSNVNDAIGVPGGMNDLFYFRGTANADLMKFVTCFLGCSGNVMTLDNPQAVVYEFFGTDILTKGSVVKVLSGGGNVNFFGGSCIMLDKAGETAPSYLLDVASTATISSGNNNYQFNGTRFEFRNTYKRIVRSDGNTTETSVTFNSCGFGSVMGGTREAVLIGAKKRVTFNDCTLSEYFTYTLTGNITTANSAYSGLLMFNRCDVGTGSATEALFKRITFSGTAGRVISKDCFQRGSTSLYTTNVTDFDLNHRNRLTREPSPVLKSVSLKPKDLSFPFVDGTNEYTVEFPVGTLIKNIFIRKEAATSSSSDYQIKIGTDDKVTVLGQSTLGAHSNEHKIELNNLYLVTDATNSKLRLWAGGTANVTKTGGVAVIEYY